MITEGAEMEQGIYKIRFDLFASGNHESDSKDLEGLVTSCETEFIYDEKSVLTETDQYSFRLLPGKLPIIHLTFTPTRLTHPRNGSTQHSVSHNRSLIPETTPNYLCPNLNFIFRFDMDFHVENRRRIQIM